MSDDRNLFERIKRHACDNFTPRRKSRPTSVRPGSKEKLAELAARVERGEELWAEDDLTCLPCRGDLRSTLDEEEQRALRRMLDEAASIMGVDSSCDD